MALGLAPLAVILTPAPSLTSHSIHVCAIEDWGLCLKSSIFRSLLSFLFISSSSLLCFLTIFCIFAGVAEVETINLDWWCETLHQDEPDLPPSGFLSPPIANRHSVPSSVDLQRVADAEILFVVIFQHSRTVRDVKPRPLSALFFPTIVGSPLR